MSNFKNYVTGGAFQLNLSRRQIDHLSFAKSHGSVINPEYASGFGTERILISKGLLETDESKPHEVFTYLKLSKEGELVCQLLDMAGLFIKYPPAIQIEPAEVDFHVELKD